VYPNILQVTFTLKGPGAWFQPSSHMVPHSLLYKTSIRPCFRSHKPAPRPSHNRKPLTAWVHELTHTSSKQKVKLIILSPQKAAIVSREP